jgi:septal ring factor EnvC (AmiA/AmiB activator)
MKDEPVTTNLKCPTCGSEMTRVLATSALRCFACRLDPDPPAPAPPTGATPLSEGEEIAYRRWLDNPPAGLVWSRKHAARLLATLDARTRERDEAIAHDRQPYPTTDAYEKVCAALSAERTAHEETRNVLAAQRAGHSAAAAESTGWLLKHNAERARREAAEEVINAIDAVGTNRCSTLAEGLDRVLAARAAWHAAKEAPRA